MRLNVIEALRLKNEISANVQKLYSKFSDNRYYEESKVSYGVTTEDGETRGSTDIPWFEEVYSCLEKAFVFSNELNTALAQHNVETGVAEAVRAKKNANALIRVLEIAVSQSSPKRESTLKDVGTEGRRVVTEYTPHQNKKDLRKQIKDLRNTVRKLENKISQADSGSIEVTFSYEDLDEVFELV
jgi:hypothetical protein